MPKHKQTKSARLAHYVAQYGVFRTDGDILYCKACNKCVSSERLHFVKSHLASAAHIAAEEKRTSVPAQPFLRESVSSKQVQFVEDLCEALIASDIPLYKLRNTNFNRFLNKYVQLVVPSESTLRRTVGKLYESTIEDIRHRVRNNYVWISIDETTDSSGRYIANVVLGILDTDETVAKQRFLLHFAQLEKADHAAVARLFDDAVKMLGPDFDKSSILLLLSDAAPYMIKAAKVLEVFYPKLTHVTCVAHGLHRVCEVIREMNPQVDQLIATVKKVFVKAPSRVVFFKTNEPDLPLPPEPILTRWGTWLEAVNYYAKHFEKLQGIFTMLNPAESKNIRKAQELLNDRSIRQNLVSISSNFGFLPKSITKLETSNLTLAAQVNIVEEARKLIESSGCDAVSTKISSVLEKNKGYQEMKKISEEISARTVSSRPDPKYTVDETSSFKFSPLTSVEVERVFSVYKSVYRDNRHSFLFENLAQVMVCYCNRNWT